MDNFLYTTIPLCYYILIVDNKIIMKYKNIRVSEDLHKQLRKLAAEAELTIKELVEKIIRKAIQ